MIEKIILIDYAPVPDRDGVWPAPAERHNTVKFSTGHLIRRWAKLSPADYLQLFLPVYLSPVDRSVHTHEEIASAVRVTKQYLAGQRIMCVGKRVRDALITHANAPDYYGWVTGKESIFCVVPDFDSYLWYREAINKAKAEKFLGLLGAEFRNG